MTTFQSLRQMREDILAVARQHGANSVRVFGSIACEADRPDSDIDLLVHMESGRDLLDLVELEQALAALLGRRVEVVTDGGLSPYLKDRILSEAVAL